MSYPLEIPAKSPLRVAVLISGGGTTLRNLLEQVEQANLQIEIQQVISSRPGVAGLAIAEHAGIPTAIAVRKDYPSALAYSESIFARCRELQVDLVVMGGFLQHVLIPDDYQFRVINIHPSLIPAFCGQGYYGLRVHQGVLDYGVKITGCTVHFVDNQYDHGPIILQRAVPVLETDTAETLAARVFREECTAYPEAIRQYYSGRMTLSGRHVRVAPV